MNDKNKTVFKENLLKRLEAEAISPHSRLYWLTHEYALWGAWGITVLLGALAVAVTSFASLHIGYALYEATHQDFLTFFFEALPYLWLMAFGLLVGVAYFNLRHTKRGYRYPILLVLGSTFGFSLIGGGLLHLLGGGWYLDKWLGETMPGYQSRAEFEEALWQRPMAGRLVGRARVGGVPAPTDTIIFMDSSDKEWQLNTKTLREREGALLLSGNKVRILMATSSLEDKDILYVCAVFPWLLDHAPMVKEWKGDRAAFVEEVRLHRQRMEQLAKEDTVPLAKSFDPAIPCDKLSPFSTR